MENSSSSKINNNRLKLLEGAPSQLMRLILPSPYILPLVFRASFKSFAQGRLEVPGLAVNFFCLVLLMRVVILIAGFHHRRRAAKLDD